MMTSVTSMTTANELLPIRTVRRLGSGATTYPASPAYRYYCPCGPFKP